MNIRNDFIGFGSAKLINDMLFVDVTRLSQPAVDRSRRADLHQSVGRAVQQDQVAFRVDQPLPAQPFRQCGGKRAALPLLLHLRRE